MKSILQRAISTLLIFWSIITTAEEPVIVFATLNNTPPLAYIDNGKNSGILIDIVRAVCMEMGYKLVVKYMPPKRVLYAVAKGEADLVLAPYFPQRLTGNTFPPTLKLGSSPILNIKLSGFALKEKRLSIQSQNDLYSYRLGHLNHMSDSRKTLLQGYVGHILKVATTEQLVKALHGGRIDIAIEGDARFDYYSSALNVKSQSEIVKRFSSIPLFPLWSKIRLKEMDIEAEAAFSKSIRKLKSNGELAEIINHYSKTEYFTDFGSTRK